MKKPLRLLAGIISYPVLGIALVVSLAFYYGMLSVTAGVLFSFWAVCFLPIGIGAGLFNYANGKSAEVSFRYLCCSFRLLVWDSIEVGGSAFRELGLSSQEILSRIGNRPPKKIKEKYERT